MGSVANTLDLDSEVFLKYYLLRGLAGPVSPPLNYRRRHDWQGSGGAVSHVYLWTQLLNEVDPPCLTSLTNGPGRGDGIGGWGD